MSDEIRPRHISVIRNLSLFELTDEEIVKVVRERLQTTAIMLCYLDEDSGRFVFLARYKNKGRIYIAQLRQAWEERFGKFKKIDEDE